jgi:hypothetical protein
VDSLLLVSDEVLDDLRGAVDAAAATFDGRGSEIKERELEMALETALWALGQEPRRQARVRLRDAWNGQVGGVDLALGSDSPPILIELKWDAGTLAASAWDSMKLAGALQSAEGKRGFLIAGSPAHEGLRGDELLEDGDVDPVNLRRQYAGEFDFWRGDVKNHPHSAPAGWRIRLHHSVGLSFKDAPWRIRLAELELTDAELIPCK